MRRKIDLAPSILSADFARLSEAVQSIEEAGADLAHLDVMDGHFVPNLTMGPPVVSWIRKTTQLPLDVHLMVEAPATYIDALAQAGANWVSVHVEADHHLHRTIQAIKERGMRAGVALNPATPVDCLVEVLQYLDFVLLLTVNPGFGGQEFIPASLKKIRKLRDLITSYNNKVRVEVDGGIAAGNLREVVEAGAQIIVAGSAVFCAGVPVSQALAELREIADSCSNGLEE